jgi:hypothetical protein
MGDAPTSFPNYIGLRLTISSSARTNPAYRKACSSELSGASQLRIFGAALLQQLLMWQAREDVVVLLFVDVGLHVVQGRPGSWESGLDICISSLAHRENSQVGSSLPDLVLSFAIILQLSSSAAHGLVLHFLKFSSSYYVEFTCHTTV